MPRLMAPPPKGAPSTSAPSSAWPRGPPAPSAAPKAAPKSQAILPPQPKALIRPKAAAQGVAVGGAGYVFLCNAATQQECEQKRLFGSPDSELWKMQQNIKSDTKLFLVNTQTQKLYGPFLAEGAPDKGLVPGSFGGRFNSHVRASPADSGLLEVKLKGRIHSGAKNAAEVDFMMKQLQEGSPAEAKVQEAWGASESSAAAEPPAKRPRLDAGAEAAGGSEPAPAASAAGGTGYLFLCNHITQRECGSLRMMAAPDMELGRMKQVITPGTQLFLLNFQSMKLVGPFVATGLPDRAIVPNSFGGRYNAQVPAAPLEAPLREVKLDTRPRNGPMTPEEVDALLGRLGAGQAAEAKVQEAWGAPAGQEIQAPEGDSEDASSTHIDVGPGTFSEISQQAREALEQDIAELREKHGVQAQLVISPAGGGSDGISLRGEAEAVRECSSELEDILAFYGASPL